MVFPLRSLAKRMMTTCVAPPRVAAVAASEVCIQINR